MTLANVDKAPFPYFGGKSKAAPLVWQLLGDVPHYVEPFFGSGAVLLNRPHPCNRTYYSETVNDLDGFVVNAWRAIQWHSQEVAEAASWPVTEADKSARQIAVLKWRTDKVLDLLAGDPRWCDPQMAGWWMWGVCVQIGAIGGPWTSDPVTGRIINQGRGVKRNLPHLGDNGRGVNRPQLREPGVTRNLPYLGDNGRGVNHGNLREPGVKRNLPHLGDDGRGVNHAGTREPGVKRNLPHLGDNGRGVNHAGTREPGVSRDLPHLGDDGKGVNRPQLREPGVLSDTDPQEYHPMTMPELRRWMLHLSARLRHVRVLNGDWARLVTKGAAWTLPVRQGNGPAGIFLDPPYSNAERDGGLYTHDDGDVAADCLTWCLDLPDDPRWRVVLAGYDTEHAALRDAGWTEHEWFTPGFLTGGMGNTSGGDGTHQQHRERLWASPHCQPLTVPDHQLGLFAEAP